MEYGHALSKHADGTTSVKIHHQPGGASSFSLGHDGASDDRFGNNNKIGAGNQNTQQQQQPTRSAATATYSQISFGGPAEEQKQPEPTPQQVQQQQQQIGGDEQGGNPSAGPGSFTSVKYSGNPPGGKSNFTLG